MEGCCQAAWPGASFFTSEHWFVVWSNSDGGASRCEWFSGFWHFHFTAGIRADTTRGLVALSPYGCLAQSAMSGLLLAASANICQHRTPAYGSAWLVGWYRLAILEAAKDWLRGLLLFLGPGP